jgi:hypothetical protein
MTLEELHLKVTNQHLPISVRNLLPQLTGFEGGPTPPTSHWRQFDRAADDSTETIKDSIHLVPI